MVIYRIYGTVANLFQILTGIPSDPAFSRDDKGLEHPHNWETYSDSAVNQCKSCVKHV